MIWDEIDLHWVYGDLLRSIYRRTRSLDRSYDVLHDSLLRFALASRREAIRQPRAYLHTVVRTVLVRHGIEAARWLPFPEGDGGEGDEHPDLVASREALDRSVDPEDFNPSPEQLAYLRERLRAVERVLDCLPPRCRTVFRLYRIDGLSQPEIARQLGISRKTVEYHLQRALVDLGVAFQELRGRELKER